MDAKEIFPGYENQSDKVLIRSIRGGDDRALSCLCYRYSPVCLALGRKYAGSGMEAEDLAQEGMIGFIEAVRRYDPEKGVPFEVYSRRCISSKIYSAIAAHLAEKRKSNVDPIPLDEQGTVVGIHAPSPDDLFIEVETVRSRSEQITSLLSKSEMEALKLYLRGCSYAQISAQLGVPQKSVDNALQRVRRKLRSAFE